MTEDDTGRGYVRAHLIAGLAVAGLGLYILVEGLSLGVSSTMTTVGPGGFPVIVGALLTALGLILFLTAQREARRRGEDSYLPERSGWWKLGATGVGVLLFCATLDLLGYVPAMFFLLLPLSLWIGKLRPWVAVVSSAGFSLISFYLFYSGLGVPLPVSSYVPIPALGF